MTEFFQKYKLALLGGGAVLLAVIAIAAAGGSQKQEAAAEPVEETIAAINSLTEEELAQMHKEETLADLTAEYERFGIVEVNGYINLRSEKDSLNTRNIKGKLSDGAACDILEEDGDWMYISSGGIEGYVSSAYVLEGDAAMEKAWENVKDRVIIDTSVLNIRSSPEVTEDNVIGKARQGERYELNYLSGDWANIKLDEDQESRSEGWVKISDGNGEIRQCLDAARNLDLRMMALTQYDELVFANPDGGYINVRKEPEDKGIDNICGKFTKGCGAELLETVENSAGKWYKIRSGSVTGYVSAKYCLTGQAAKDSAVEYAELTAYVKVDALNVRTEPSMDGKVWTSITRNQAYEVANQFDGWVELALDSTDDGEENDKAFVSTRDNNVEVRYGLKEATEYYPAVEAANAAAAYRNKVINYACQFIGNPYVWGGTSLTRGADCSGFVLSVMAHFGISLPRTSASQAKCGTKVTSDQMKPGDLVFYANSGGRVNHVGIYIGNGQIVNAASRRSGIKISRWNYRTPAAIRNVIGP